MKIGKKRYMLVDDARPGDERPLKLGRAYATGWFAADLRNARRVVSTWPKSMLHTPAHVRER